MQRYLRFTFLVIIGFLLTFLLTWPLVTKIDTYYPDTSEYAFVGWILWYNQHSIVTGKILDQQSYFNSNQFYPLPTALSYSEHLFIPSLIFAPIYWLTKNLIVSVNCFNILTFVLSFVSSFYCLKFFVKRNLPSLVGAFIFTFNPLTFAQFFGHHLQLMNKYFLPPLFLFAYLYIKEPTLKRSFYFFTFFTLNALSNIYFQAFSLIFIPLFWSPFVINYLMKKDVKFFISFIKTSLIFVVFLPILYYFNSPYLQFSSMEGVKRSLEENAYNSARGLDWISSLRTNFLYGKFIQSLYYFREPKSVNGVFNYTEHTLFPNLLPLLLFFIGLFTLRVNKVNIALILMLIVSAIFTFGPATLFYEKIYELLIFLQGIRVPTRFQFIFYLPFALIVSFGVDKLLIISKKLYIFVFGVICLLLVLENINTVDFNQPSQILQSTLINSLKNKNTIHLPFATPDIGNNIRYLSWSTRTGETLFNGYSGYFPSDWVDLGMKAENLDKGSLEKFYVLGIDYLIIHKDLLSQEKIKVHNNNLDFLRQAIVFQDDKLIVIDFKKFNFNPAICYLRDMEFDTQLFPKITLVNPGDCYLVNKYQDRYFKFRSINIKLPILIEPYQKIRVK